MKMKKFFALAILLSTSLTGQCFATDLEDDLEKNFYVGTNIIMLGVPYYDDETAIDNFRGSIIGGYNYTEDVKTELEIMFGFPLEEGYAGTLLANLHYSHKIKNVALTPYFGIGIGIVKYWSKDSDTNDTEEQLSSIFLAHQIKIGVEYPVTSEISVSGGYRFIAQNSFNSEILNGLGNGVTSYGLEVGISYNF